MNSGLKLIAKKSNCAKIHFAFYRAGFTSGRWVIISYIINSSKLTISLFVDLPEFY